MHRFGILFKPPALVVLMYFSESVICNNVKLSCWAGWGGGRLVLNVENCAYSWLHPCMQGVNYVLQAFLLPVESSSLFSLKLIVVTKFIYDILVYLKVMEVISWSVG